MSSNDRTVYSTETGRFCPKCGYPLADCRCKRTAALPPSDGVVRVSRDSKHRKGKTVTLVTGVQLPEEQLRELASALKRLCGSGGTVKEASIEIQGDHREKIVTELKSLGYKVKLVGG